MWKNKKFKKKKTQVVELTNKQKGFLRYLQELGYEKDKDIHIKPNKLSIMINHMPSVYKRYCPIFYVASELTCYDVDSNHDLEFLEKAKGMIEENGYELVIVNEAEFPFEEYLNT